MRVEKAATVCGHGRTRSIPKAESNNQFIVVMAGQYSKITKVVLTFQTTAIASEATYVHSWTSESSIPTIVATENDRKCTLKFFQAVCSKLCITPLKPTEYPPQTNEQVEKYNAAIISLLRHYMVEHEQDSESLWHRWDKCTVSGNIGLRS